MLELETDNEHVKNVLIALNEKLLVFNDFKQDVANHKQFLKESENRRETLQMDIRTISTKVITDTQEHTSYESQLVNENKSLKTALE